MKNYDILLIEKDVCFIMNYTIINAYSEGLPKVAYEYVCSFNTN